jgi:hypothetical protein
MADQNRKWLTFWLAIFEWVIITLMMNSGALDIPVGTSPGPASRDPTELARPNQAPPMRDSVLFARDRAVSCLSLARARD